MKDQSLLDMYINKCEKEYALFIGIESLPPFQIVPKTITLDLANKQDFDSFASASYDVATGTHSLKVWSDVYKPQLHADYLLFHEFTHILDAEMYSNRDKVKYVGNRGFTEYHAAQIDFMKLLGAENVNNQFSFSMSTKFETVGGQKSAGEFVAMPHSLATELIGRADFPANIETLAVTLGVIFNYLGRRSICKMYARDFVESVDNSTIEGFIGTEPYNALNAYMVGWLNSDRVQLLDQLYYRMAISMAQKYHLG